MVAGFSQNATDRNLRAWLSAGPVDRGIGDGLTFVASAAGAARGKASWILRFRHGGRQREKVLGRYPDISLKEARELARRDRGLLQQGQDVAAAKQLEKASALAPSDVAALADAWYARHILSKHKHPEVVERVLRRYIKPLIGKLAIQDVRPTHVDLILTRIVDAGAPTVSNDALRYLFRMFHFAVKRKWIETNPAYGFDLSDAGGTESSRDRWLKRDELILLARDMRETINFGRINELAVWLLLALCVRKMELLSAKWTEFNIESGVWHLRPSRTKTATAIDIPLAQPVLDWLKEVQVHAGGSEYVFPARRLIRRKMGVARQNRFAHIGPDTLNVALNRLPRKGMEHFTIHDMRRTARSHMASMGISRFVAERSLNHKLRDIEGVYDQYDYFAERKSALAKWAQFLVDLQADLGTATARLPGQATSTSSQACT